MKDRKGAIEILPLVAVFGILALVALGSIGAYRAGWFSSGETAAFTTTDSNGNVIPIATGGVTVESLSVLQTNKYTSATEGGDDVEFWDLGVDVSDTSKSAREVLDLTSGAVTDTGVPSLLSTDTQATKDLYVEGTGNYYDDKILAWSIRYNAETGKGVLVGDGPSGSVVATDVGTFADIDTASALGTGFVVGDAAGEINYSDSAGTDGGYIRLEMGNTEADSELRDVAFCVGDADGDMEGNEITSMTISHYSGTKVVSPPSNILSLFTNSAGTGAMNCVKMGDIIGNQRGVFQIDFVIAEANTDAGNEEIEFGLDDLGGWKVRQYPSSNLKATAEDLVLAFES